MTATPDSRERGERELDPLDPKEREARRNVALLVAAQSVGGAAAPIIISLGGIVGQMLSRTPSLATLPVSLYNLGLALSTLPAAWLMRRQGRRAAYLFGALTGSLSAALAGYAVVRGQFELFCVSLLVAGYYGACVQSYRFAANDAASPAWRPLAISRVMVGGLIAAVIGPQIVIWTRDAIPGVPIAGSFFGQAALALLALPVLAGLRMPRPAAQARQASTGRPLSVIARQPEFVVAVLAGVVSYGLMSFVMTAAPMAMVDCGHTVGEAALGIQWHVLSMFGPSFFTGRLIQRYGKRFITGLGLALIAAAGALALTGLGLTQFWGSLVLLGVGWNFGFIGSTTMVTDCYRPEERGKVQALNDFLVFGTVAAASFSSGRLLSASGWSSVNLLIFPLVAAVIGLLTWATWIERKGRTAASA